MPDLFVPLAEVLRPRPQAAAEEAEPLHPIASTAKESPPSAIDETPLREALDEVRRFRAALADAAELMQEWIARDIACDVLARELQLADADVAAIANNAVQRALSMEPLAVLVHPTDTSRAQSCGLPVECDESMHRGDVRIRIRCGTIDVSLGARLETVLESLR